MITFSHSLIPALKVKLMVRRPMTTLVAQGIVPKSPALHEQLQKLERAKMGDMLRAKIAKRPARSELVNRHILEDVRPGVDPSLYDKQRQLKRAKLIDSLSNQLQARPGPLELVQKNILHTDDDTVELAVKQGAIHFKPTNEGVPVKHVELPRKYTDNNDDSNSESAPHSPQDLLSSVASTPNSTTQQLSPLPVDIVNSSVVKSESHDTIFTAAGTKAPVTKSEKNKCDGHKRRASDVGPGLFAVPSPATPSNSSQSPSPSPAQGSSRPGSLKIASSLPYSQRSAPGKDQSTRKSKKVKQIGFKFHEYKGPGGSQKKSSSSATAADSDSKKSSKELSSYDLLLQQQQLYLQWQLEHSHKKVRRN